MTGVGVERGRDRIERIWGRKIEEDGLKFLIDFIDIIDINFNIYKTSETSEFES